MLKKKLLVTLAVTSLLLAQLPVSAATSFGLYPLKISVKEGQTFKLAVNVNPNNLKNYTIKASVKFPSELVTVTSWQFAGSWQPLSQPGYDSIDNSEGILIKTAGYPGGLSKNATLGIITFKAKKTGTGTVSFTGLSMALDEGNTNQYSGGNQVPLTIEDLAETPVVIKPTTSTTPTKPSSEVPESATFEEVATSTELNPPLGEQPEIITIATNTKDIISPEEFKNINKNLENINNNLANFLAVVHILLLAFFILFMLVILLIIVLLFCYPKKESPRTNMVVNDGKHVYKNQLIEKSASKGKIKGGGQKI